jgi:hypothetical protein
MAVTSASRSDFNRPVQATPRACPAHVTVKAAAAAPLSDPFGTDRLTRSKATTPEGYQRLANDISRQLIGIPFTRKAQDEIREIRGERKRPSSELVDKNAYRQKARKYVPYERRSRRRRGWRRCELVLPYRLLEGLRALAKTKAEELAIERLQQPWQLSPLLRVGLSLLLVSGFRNL